MFGKKKLQKKQLTHQGFLANMPLGKYLEYIIKGQEKAEKKTVTAQPQYAAASCNNKLLLVLQSVFVGGAWLLYCLFHTQKNTLTLRTTHLPATYALMGQMTPPNQLSPKTFAAQLIYNH